MENNRKQNKQPSTSNTRNILAVVLLVAAVLTVFLIKSMNSAPKNGSTAAAPGSSGKPMLVDVGASKCIPCKLMEPILEDLDSEYKGVFDVVVIDIAENPKAAKPYNIKIIPTQIFYDNKGDELYRHEGFLSKEAILQKWEDLGISLEKNSETTLENNTEEKKNEEGN